MVRGANVQTPDREAHTPAMLLWAEALRFADAATVLTPVNDTRFRFRTPALHLAAHSIELAMKSFLRAEGCSLEELIRLRHSLVDILAACEARGMQALADADGPYLGFLSEAHEQQEFRYPHLNRPPHMEREDWARLAEWALRAAIPAVSDATPPAGSLSGTMLARVDKVFAADHDATS